jgi:SdrD B-like domain
MHVRSPNSSPLPKQSTRSKIGRVSRALLGVSLVASGLAQTTRASAAPSTITGTVFFDFGADGSMNTTGAQTDRGVENILLRAFDSAGTPCGLQATTSSTGTYAINHSCTGTIRVEATWDEWENRFIGVKPGPHGPNNGGTVQFVAANATGVDVGLIRPSDFCGTTPELVTSCFLNGSASNDLNTAKSLSKFAWGASGDGRGSTQNTKLADRQTIGSVWGIAVQRSTGDVFSSAVLRRHVGMGPGGIAQIYKTTSAGATTPFLNLGTSFGTFDESTRGLGNAATPSHDDLAYPAVGKVGIGDIEINDAGTILYASNLATQQIVSTPMIGPLNLVAYPTPRLHPTDCATSGQGTERVWGLKTRSFTAADGTKIDRVFAGVVCDSPVVGAGDIGGVYYLDVNATTRVATTTYWSPAVTVPNYISGGEWGAAIAKAKAWMPWSNTDSNTAKSMIISNIDFDANGDMTIGIMDRTGLQYSDGNFNDVGATAVSSLSSRAGDTLKACAVQASPAVSFTLETNASCGGNTTAGIGVLHLGLGTSGEGEFYYQDDWNGTVGSAGAANGHPELSLGALALLPGSNQVAVSAIDPNQWFSSGIRWFDQTNGTSPRQLIIAGANTNADAAIVDPGGLGKADGIGDIELLCGQAPFEVGNRVWIDTNGDGIQDPNEAGVLDVDVELLNAAGTTVIATTPTDANGTYYFSSTTTPGLTANTNYKMRIASGQAALVGYVPTAVDADPTSANSDARDSDGTLIPASVNGSSYAFSTGSAASDHTIDFGFNPVPTVVYSLGNRVWMDTNNNGTFETGDMPVDGVNVSLLDSAGVAIAGKTTVSAAGGYYRFDGLASGDYKVLIDASNFASSGALFGKESSTTTESNPNTDVDLNDNGIDPATSAAYLADGVRSGTVTLGALAEPTGEATSGTAGGAPDAQSNLTVDFGFYTAYSLGNRVFMDNNTNGIFDTGDMGLNDVVVSLLDSGGTPVPGKFMPTANNGFYRFDGLPAGSYRIRVESLNFDTGGSLLSKVSTTPDVVDPENNDDNDDNGVDPVAYSSGVTSGLVILGPTEPLDESDALTGGSPDAQANLTVDFGFKAAPVVVIEKYSIGNRVWMDTNNDGFINNGEAGIDGVSVTLLDNADVPVVGIPTTATASGGYYRFDDLVAGNYKVRIDSSNFVTGAPLAGKESSVPTVTDADLNADLDDNGIDSAAFATNGIISNAVTLGANAEPTGETDKVVSALDAPDARSNLTIDFGFYTPTPPVELYSIGNRVWLDADTNGVDNGEAGIAGVTVTLLDSADANVGSAITSTNGYYRFDGKIAGNYRVRIDASNFAALAPLDGKQSSTQDVANANGDVDLDDNGIDIATFATAGITSGVVTLGGNAEPTTDADGKLLNPAGDAPDNRSNLTVDFGFYTVVVVPPTEYYSIGNRVWMDTNNDGIHQTATEMGVGNVDVSLLKAGISVQTTSTSATGFYRFDGLVAGNYSVRIEGTNFTGAGVLVGKVSSVQTTANADGNADLDDNGVNIATYATAGITSGVVTLGLNAEPTAESDVSGVAETTVDARSNLTVDFGFYTPAVIDRYSIGNRVWMDANNDGLLNNGEMGIDGVAVLLLDGAGSPAGTFTTAGGGYYRFDNLLAGNYTVRIDASNFATGGALAGKESSVTTTNGETNPADGDDNGINDPNYATTGIVSNVITLGGRTEPNGETNLSGTPGGEVDNQSNLTVDFGFHTPSTTTPSSSTTTTTTTTTTTVAPVASIVTPTPVTPVTPVAETPVTAPTVAPTTSTTPAPTTKAAPVTTAAPAVEPTPDKKTGLSSNVFVDANNNGKQDPGEGVVAGAKIEVRNAAGVVVATATTDAEGKYVLGGLTPGVYTVAIVGGVPPELAFLTKKVATVTVLGESITNAEFRVSSEEGLAFTGSNSLLNTGFAMMLVGLGVLLLLSPGTIRRRKTR